MRTACESSADCPRGCDCVISGEEMFAPRRCIGMRMDQRPRIIASSTVRFSFGRFDGGVGALRFCGGLACFSSWPFLCLESDLCFISSVHFGFGDIHRRSHAMRRNPWRTKDLQEIRCRRGSARRLRIDPSGCRVPLPFCGVRAAGDQRPRIFGSSLPRSVRRLSRRTSCVVRGRFSDSFAWEVGAG